MITKHLQLFEEACGTIWSCDKNLKNIINLSNIFSDFSFIKIRNFVSLAVSNLIHTYSLKLHNSLQFYVVPRTRHYCHYYYKWYYSKKQLKYFKYSNAPISEFKLYLPAVTHSSTVTCLAVIIQSSPVMTGLYLSISVIHLFDTTFKV